MVLVRTPKKCMLTNNVKYGKYLKFRKFFFVSQYTVIMNNFNQENLNLNMINNQINYTSYLYIKLKIILCLVKINHFSFQIFSLTQYNTRIHILITYLV